MDPGNAALHLCCCCFLLPPLSSSATVSAATIGRHRWHLLPLVPPSAGASGHCWRRCQLPSPSTNAAGGGSCSCLHCRPLPPPPADAPTAARHFRQPLPLRRCRCLPQPSPYSATTNEQIQYLRETKRPKLIFISPLHLFTIHHFTILPLVSLK